MSKKITINNNDYLIFQIEDYPILIHKNLVMNSALQYNFIITENLSDDVEDIRSQLIEEISNWKYKHVLKIFKNKSELIDLFKIHTFYINTVRKIIDTLSRCYVHGEALHVKDVLSSILYVKVMDNLLVSVSKYIVKFTILCIVFKHFKLSSISNNDFQIILNNLVDDLEQIIGGTSSLPVGFLWCSNETSSGYFRVDVDVKQTIFRLKELVKELFTPHKHSDVSFLDIQRKLYHYNRPQSYNKQFTSSLLPKQGRFTTLRFI